MSAERRIAFVSGVESSGGAARAAIRIHDALAAMPDLCVRHFTGRVDRQGSGAVCFSQPGRLRTGVLALAGLAGCADSPRLASWQGRANARNLLRLVREWEPSAIHLHNISPWTGVGFGREIVPALSEIAPVVWRMPDMWAVSGCCSYVDFCERGGRNCLWAARTRSPQSAEEQRLRHEQEALAALGDRLVLASPSSWLADIARREFGGRLRVEHILSGLDLDFWQPLDRPAARAALGLPAQGFLALAIAERLSLRLKGTDELLRALDACGAHPPRLLTAGALKPADQTRFPADTLHLGPVSDDRVLRLAMAAANVVAVPSLAENLPGVAVEALSCGRPVVAFATGGIPDIVRPGLTGWLAPPGDTGTLAKILLEAAALPPGEAAALCASCRAFATEHFDAVRQARLFADLTAAGAAL